MRRIDQFGEKYLEDDGDEGYYGYMKRQDDIADEEEQAKFNNTYGPIAEKVIKACREAGHKKVYVQYSAYDMDECGGYPLDNLDEVAFDSNDKEPLGDNVIIYLPKCHFFGGVRSQTYKSQILNSPIWLEIAVIANEVIRVTRDKHHVYLEALKRAYPSSAKVDIKYYKLIMGS